MVARAKIYLAACAWICGLTVCQFAAAQRVENTEAFELPQDPRVWINGPPIALGAMKGKSVVLYFFEEDCPRCAANWPAVVTAASQSNGRPVLVIGVNSGNSPAEVARYVREKKVSIPVIVDSDRSIEKAAGVGEISLRNIMQVVIVDGEGKLRRARAGDMRATIDAAAENASWNVDPRGMPRLIEPLWRNIEFGDYAGTSRLLQRYRRDRDADIRAAAERLDQYVQNQLQALIDEAEMALANEDNWRAWKAYQIIYNQFSGFDFPDSVKENRARLAKDGEVKRQLAAMKRWERTKRTLAGGRLVSTRISALLRDIVDDYPDTEAAELAKQALASATR